MRITVHRYVAHATPVVERNSCIDGGWDWERTQVKNTVAVTVPAFYLWFGVGDRYRTIDCATAARSLAACSDLVR